MRYSRLECSTLVGCPGWDFGVRASKLLCYLNGLCCLKFYQRGQADPMSKDTKDAPEQEKFKKALASVLSASPEQIRESRVLAKAEKPSPHKRYTYATEEGQP